MVSPMSLYQRKRRQKCKGLGICIHCCCRPSSSGFSSCGLCREAIRLRMSINRFVNKPAKPDKCPLCEDGTGKFHWHHWDDNDMKYGMWVCPHCNLIVELEDRGLVDKYRLLKADIHNI